MNQAHEFQQPFLPMFTATQIGCWEQEQRQQEEKKKKRQLYYINRKAPLTAKEVAILELPLFTWREKDDLLVGDFLVGDDLVVVSSVKEKPTPWTDRGVSLLHDTLLHRSLEYLAARGNPVEKLDVLNWIFHPEVPDQVTRTIDGKRERILIPFTFGACCAFSGLNEEALRDQIGSICRKAGIAIQ